MDREKVIKAVEEAFDLVHSDYVGTYDFDETEWEKNKADALALLKEQEAKWVEDKQDERCRLIKCSKCGLTFIVGNNIPYDEWIEDRNYCRRCGARMVKQ